MSELWNLLSLVGSAAFLLGCLSLLPYLSAWQIMGEDWARADQRLWPRRMWQIARMMKWSGMLTVGGGSLVLLAIALRGFIAGSTPLLVRVAVVGSLGIGICCDILGGVALVAWLLLVAHASLRAPTSAILRGGLERFGRRGQLILLLGVTVVIAAVAIYLGQQIRSTWTLANATASSRLILGIIAAIGFFAQMIGSFLFVFLLPSGSQR